MSAVSKTTFLTPFSELEYGDGVEPKSHIDQILTKISAAIRLKPNWQNKINNADIVKKWQEEALVWHVNDKQLQYVIDELRYLSTLSKDNVRISPVDGVWESDDLIDMKTKNELLQYVKKLEDVPESQKDWHPGSNHQVLDLVHPSLYPYINRVTKITSKAIPLMSTLECVLGMPTIPSTQVSFINDGFFLTDGFVKKHEPYDKSYAHDYSLSKKYQWLPSEFHIGMDGHVTIQSYINNLHPVEHKPLYGVLEDIFAAFVPLFNCTLTDLLDYKNKKNRIAVDADWYQKNDDDFEDKQNKRPINIPDVDADWYQKDDDDFEDKQNMRLINIPDVDKFVVPKPKTPFDLKGHNVQVIVKLANIELTPLNPQYPGGSWHVEGMKNENIVASGIYYYSFREYY